MKKKNLIVLESPDKNLKVLWSQKILKLIKAKYNGSCNARSAWFMWPEMGTGEEVLYTALSRFCTMMKRILEEKEDTIVCSSYLGDLVMNYDNIAIQSLRENLYTSLDTNSMRKLTFFLDTTPEELALSKISKGFYTKSDIKHTAQLNGERWLIKETKKLVARANKMSDIRGRINRKSPVILINCSEDNVDNIETEIKNALEKYLYFRKS